MNETNPLETPLQSWTPRRPSEKIKNHLFPARRSVAVEEASFSWSGLLPFAAPALACLLAVLAIDPTLFRVGSGRSSGFFATVSSNGFDAAGGFMAEKTDRNLDSNICSKATFEWTNRQVSSSSNGSLQLAKTNLLFR